MWGRHGTSVRTTCTSPRRGAEATCSGPDSVLAPDETVKSHACDGDSATQALRDLIRSQYAARVFEKDSECSRREGGSSKLASASPCQHPGASRAAARAASPPPTPEVVRPRPARSRPRRPTRRDSRHRSRPSWRWRADTIAQRIRARRGRNRRCAVSSPVTSPSASRVGVAREVARGGPGLGGSCQRRIRTALPSRPPNNRLVAGEDAVGGR